MDPRHVYIRPHTPCLNGKVERSHRVDDQEFYQLLDKDRITDDIHLFNEKLREWVRARAVRGAARTVHAGSHISDDGVDVDHEASRAA